MSENRNDIYYNVDLIEEKLESLEKQLERNKEYIISLYIGDNWYYDFNSDFEGAKSVIKVYELKDPTFIKLEELNIHNGKYEKTKNEKIIEIIEAINKNLKQQHEKYKFEEINKNFEQQCKKHKPENSNRDFSKHYYSNSY